MGMNVYDPRTEYPPPGTLPYKRDKWAGLGSALGTGISKGIEADVANKLKQENDLNRILAESKYIYQPRQKAENDYRNRSLNISQQNADSYSKYRENAIKEQAARDKYAKDKDSLNILWKAYAANPTNQDAYNAVNNASKRVLGIGIPKHEDLASNPEVSKLNIELGIRTENYMNKLVNAKNPGDRSKIATKYATSVMPIVQQLNSRGIKAKAPDIMNIYNTNREAADLSRYRRTATKGLSSKGETAGRKLTAKEMATLKKVKVGESFVKSGNQEGYRSYLMDTYPKARSLEDALFRDNMNRKAFGLPPITGSAGNLDTGFLGLRGELPTNVTVAPATRRPGETIEEYLSRTGER